MEWKWQKVHVSVFQVPSVSLSVAAAEEEAVVGCVSYQLVAVVVESLVVVSVGAAGSDVASVGVVVVDSFAVGPSPQKAPPSGAGVVEELVLSSA